MLDVLAPLTKASILIGLFQVPFTHLIMRAVSLSTKVPWTHQ